MAREEEEVVGGGGRTGGGGGRTGGSGGRWAGEQRSAAASEAELGSSLSSACQRLLSAVSHPDGQEQLLVELLELLELVEEQQVSAGSGLCLLTCDSQPAVLAKRSHSHLDLDQMIQLQQKRLCFP